MSNSVLVGVQQDALRIIVSSTSIRCQGEDVGSDDRSEIEVSWF